MPQVVFRVDLKDSRGFPLLSEFLGRTVMMAGQDLQLPKRLITGGVEGNLASPDIYYCHNVIPNNQGYQSISYKQLAIAPYNTDNTFTQIFTLLDGSGNKAYFAITLSGNCYVLLNYLSGWVQTTSVAPSTYGGLVTTAYVNGITYIYFSGVGCYQYNWTTNTLDPVSLTGLVPSAILGIAESKGFMLAYSTTTCVWSSAITPTDFTPSIITGAGGGSIQGLKGTVVFAKRYKYGLMLYSTYNCIAVIFTGNANYPFNFSQVPGSGGISAPWYVDIDPVTSEHYAYTTDGLQLVTYQQSNNVLPEITDFFAGARFEDFNETTGVFTTTTLSSPMLKRITTIADRYVIFSYGIDTYTYALVYDTTLQRLGKLKVTHVDCFEYVLFGSAAIDSPRTSVGFLQADGTVLVASFTIDPLFGSGVMIVGKFQLDRAHTFTLQNIELENVPQASNFVCSDMYTIDGKTVAGIVPGYLLSSSGMMRTYGFNISGMNHSILFTGAFSLDSILLRGNEGGYR